MKIKIAYVDLILYPFPIMHFIIPICDRVIKLI